MKHINKNRLEWTDLTPIPQHFLEVLLT